MIFLNFNGPQPARRGSIKKALTEAPVLAYPDYSKPFILETDASLKGLGVVLSQKGDDNEIRVIAYASRSL